VAGGPFDDTLRSNAADNILDRNMMAFDQIQKEILSL
jgi:hypothetical protein